MAINSFYILLIDYGRQVYYWKILENIQLCRAPGRHSPWACCRRAGSTWSSACGSGTTLPKPSALIHKPYRWENYSAVIISPHCCIYGIVYWIYCPDLHCIWVYFGASYKKSWLKLCHVVIQEEIVKCYLEIETSSTRVRYCYLPCNSLYKYMGYGLDLM